MEGRSERVKSAVRSEETGKVTMKEGKAFVRGSEQGKISVKGGDKERNLTGEVRWVSKVNLEAEEL